MRQIHVCGFVRCGNRWLGRLLAYYGDERVDADVFSQEHYWFASSQTRYFGEPVEIKMGGHRYVPPALDDGAHLVHISRDPRDVFVSWYQFLIHMKNDLWDEEHKTWKGFMQWLVGEHMHDFREYTESWLSYKQSNPPHVSWVKHEVLFSNPAAELLRLMGEMGYPQNTERARHAAKAAQSEPRRTSYTDPLRKTRRGLPGQWVDWFDAEDAQHIDAHYGDLLARLGYGKDGDWLALIGKG